MQVGFLAQKITHLWIDDCSPVNLCAFIPRALANVGKLLLTPNVNMVSSS